MRSDTELLLASKNDAEAFAELYRRTIDRLIAFAARRSTDVNEVADVVADTFVVALQSRSSYEPDKGEPLHWLYGIERRLLSNRARRRGRELRATSRIIGHRLLDNNDIERLENAIDAARRLPEMNKAFDRLDGQHREALILIGVEHLSVAEAAYVTGMLPAAFRMRLSRARKTLRSVMGDASEEADSASLSQPPRAEVKA